MLSKKVREIQEKNMGKKNKITKDYEEIWARTKAKNR